MDLSSQQQQQRRRSRSCYHHRRRRLVLQQKQQHRRSLRPPQPPPPLTLWFFLVVAFASTINLWGTKTTFVYAAHSARRRSTSSSGGSDNAAKYDREITTFSPDGRLSQVEYAMEAARRGSSVMAVKLSSLLPAGQPNNNKQGHDMIVVCVESSSSSSSTASSNSPSDGKVHRIDDHVWMMTSGLSGDARSLAMSARTWCQNYKQTFGEAPTPQQVATDYVATYHHALTKQGGARPLGCSSLIVGVDKCSFGGASIYQVEPGGGVSSSSSSSSPTTMTFSSSRSADHASDPEGSPLSSLDRMHVIGRHQQDTKMMSDVKTHIETGLLMANKRQQQRNVDRTIELADEVKQEVVGNNIEDNDTVLKTAMIVADSFLRQIDPTTGGSQENRKRRTKRDDDTTISREDDGDLPTTTKSVDVWVIQPNNHHGCHRLEHRHRHRGGMVTTCYRNINKQHTEAILQQQRQQQQQEAGNE